ncbi:MAG: VOC family protein [Methanobacteriota archaeon]
MGFIYTGVRVRDLDLSIDFYTRVLGMRVTFRMNIRETGGKIAILKSPRSRQRLELNWYPPKGLHARYRHGDELDHLGFTVPDVDRFLRRHRGELTVCIKPFDEGPWRLAFIEDPDGAWVELGSLRRRRSKARRPAARRSTSG